jgi:2,3-diphosphopglycerate-independent phosphoglycerate mutase
MKPGDIAFKSNFATLDPKTNIVTSRRADRNFEELGPPLCSYLNHIKIPGFPGYQVDLKYATEHRCGVRIRGPGLSDQISGTDPLKDNLPLVTCVPLDDSEEAKNTSKIINALSAAFHESLSKHPINETRAKEGKDPANLILLRGCGGLYDVESFERRHGLKAFMVAPTCIIKGLGMSLSIDIVDAPGATGDYHTDLLSKGRTAVQTLIEKNYDFGFVHVKAVDDAGHDRNIDRKLEFLAKIDEMIGLIVGKLVEEEAKGETEFSICLTGDHSTPVLYGDHSCEPVPFAIAKVQHVWKLLQAKLSADDAEDADRRVSLITSKSEDSDGVFRFSEIDASRGSLGRFPGSEVMPIIKSYLQS